MEQKRAMLYPDPSSIPIDERHSASEALGLPTEPPPSYATATNTVQQQQPYQFNDEVNRTFAGPAQNIQTTEPTVTTGQVPTVTDQSFDQRLGPNPCSVKCPVCNTFNTTQMTHTPNLQTHIIAGVFCLIGWCCCACLIPYCMNSCRNANHYCGQCNAYLGTSNSKIFG